MPTDLTNSLNLPPPRWAEVSLDTDIKLPQLTPAEMRARLQQIAQRGFDDPAAIMRLIMAPSNQLPKLPVEPSQP